MPSEKVRRREPAREDPIPEVLHALCQPLTSLRCALETTLAQPRDSEQYRISLRESLGLAEEISELTAGLRELLEVEKAEPPVGGVDLDEALREAVADLLPVAHSRNSRVLLKCESHLRVKGERGQLMKALLYLLSFALHFGRDATIHVHAGKASPEARLVILIPSAKARNVFWPAKETKSSNQAARGYLKFLVARSIFERMGGSLRIVQETEQVTVRVDLAGLVGSAFHPRRTKRQGIARQP